MITEPELRVNVATHPFQQLQFRKTLDFGDKLFSFKVSSLRVQPNLGIL